MVLRPVPDPPIVTRDGVSLFGIDANCHGPLSQGGLPLHAIWHNEDIQVFPDLHDKFWVRFLSLLTPSIRKMQAKQKS
jgi:hypothetical protein